jgi:hypothetical protein
MEYVQVNSSTGEVEVIIYTTEGQPEPSVGTDGAVTILVKPNDGTIEEYLNKYYDFSTSTWHDKPTKPNEFYDYGTGFSVIFNAERFLEAVRVQRNSKLYQTDWTQANDAPLTAEQKTAWAVYRQELRDLPQGIENIISLDDIVWPTQPI